MKIVVRDTFDLGGPRFRGQTAFYDWQIRGISMAHHGKGIDHIRSRI